MIVVAAHVVVKPGNEKTYIDSVQDCIQNTRKEGGNISYTLLQSTEDSCKFTFLEEWRSQEDLNMHMITPHFKALGGIIENLIAGPMDVKVYDSTLM